VGSIGGNSATLGVKGQLRDWDDPRARPSCDPLLGVTRPFRLFGIGDKALVNPPPGCVIEQIREFDPILVGPTGGRGLCAELLLVAQWVVISLLIAVSLAVDATHHPTLSAGADVAVVVVYVVSASAVGASRE
jgi:hypothetical protein